MRSGRRNLTIAAAIMALIGGVAFASMRIPGGCYTSPEGAVNYGDWAHHLFRLNFRECDPFADIQSERPIGVLSIAYAFEGGGAALDGIELVIRPDGTARLARGFASDDYKVVRLTPADYVFFRQRLTPLRNYAQTRVPGQHDYGLFEGDLRPNIACDSTSSLHPNGLFVEWNLDDDPAVTGTPRPSEFSRFDLGCQGPAGSALQTRTKPVIDQLFVIEGRLNLNREGAS